MASAAIARSIIVVFGLLYPAYNSYKAIKTRSVKLYVKWMVYWIVFALFYNVETITDLLISWFPMYYELKAIFVIWLLSPATQGAEVLYGLYIHPRLEQHEEEIEQTIQKVKTQSYSALLNVGAQGMNMALQGAIVGQTKLAEQLRRSYSLEDTTDSRSSRLALTELQERSEDEVYGELSKIQADRGYGSFEYNSQSLTESLIRHRHRYVPSDPSIQNEPQSHIQTSRERRTNCGSDDDNSSPLRTRYKKSQRTISAPEVPLRRPSSSPSQRADIKQRHSSPVSQSKLGESTSTIQKKTAAKSVIAKPVPRKHPATSQTQPASRQAAKTTTTRAPPTARETKPTETNETSSDSVTGTPPTAVEKSTVTESVLRYRTKKISDIKHQKIKTPFMSMW